MSLTREDGQLRIEGGSGSGDVVGPAGAIDGDIVIFDGATGKLIKDSGIQISSLTGGTTRAALSFFALDGEDGADGFVALNVPGPQGIQGIQGVPGTNGTNGIIGANGLDGENGQDGIDGFSIVGPQGIQGIQGTAGASGSNGLNGFPGLDGESGSDGFDGFSIPGPQGLQGLTGTTGATGATGPVAIAFDGLDGDEGFFGLPGRNGADGLAGADGVQPPAFIELFRYAFKRISFLESALKIRDQDITRVFVTPDNIGILGDYDLWNSR